MSNQQAMNNQKAMNNMLLSQEEIKEILAKPRTNILDVANAKNIPLEGSMRETFELAWGKDTANMLLAEGGYLYTPSKGFFQSDKEGINAPDALTAATVLINTLFVARSGGRKLPVNDYYDIRQFTHIQVGFSKLKDLKEVQRGISTTISGFNEVGELYNQLDRLVQITGQKYGDFITQWLQTSDDEVGDYRPGAGINWENSLYQHASDEEIEHAKTLTAAWQMTQNACFMLFTFEDKIPQEPDEEGNNACFLAHEAFRGAVEEFFSCRGRKLPKNLFFTNFSFEAGSHNVSFKEIRKYLQILSDALGTDNNGRPYIFFEDEEDGSFTVFFEERAVFLEFTKEGLIRDDRGRFVQHEILVNTLHCINGKHAEPINAPKESLTFLPSGAALMHHILNAIPCLPQGGIYKVAHVMRNYVMRELSFCALEETGGAVSGDRLFREKGVVIEKKENYEVPFKFIEGQVFLKNRSSLNDYREALPSIFAPSKYMDKAMMDGIGAIRVHKNSMRIIDAPVWHLNELSFDLRIKYLTQFLNKIGESRTVTQYCKEVFGVSINSEKELDTFTSQLVMGDITKADKFTKRSELNKAVSGVKVDGYQNGERRNNSYAVYPVEVGNDEADGVTYNGLITRSVFPAPGECYALAGADYRQPLKRIATLQTDFNRYKIDQNSGWPVLSYLIGKENDFTKSSRPGSREFKYTFTQPLHLPNPRTGEDKWVIDEGLQVQKDQLLCKVPYPIKDEEGGRLGYHQVLAPENMVVKELRFTVLRRGTQDHNLQVKVVGYVIEDVAKLRGFLKALPIEPVTGQELIDNKYNTHISESVRKGTQLVTSADADKSSDNIRYTTDAVVQTLRETEEGRKLIYNLNKEIWGIEDDQSLPWDNRAGFLGLYDHLHKHFDEQFTTSVWLYNRDHGDLSQVVRKMLRIWSQASADLFEEKNDKEEVKRSLDMFWTSLSLDQAKELGINEEALESASQDEEAEIFIDCHPSDYDPVHTHVFVFYKDEHELYPYVFLERAGAKAGNEETHVKIPAKQELSSVAQVLSASELMDVVLRTVENGVLSHHEHGVKPNPELAKELSAGMTDRAKRWSTFVAMQQELPLMKDGQYLPEVNLFTEGKDADGNRIDVINPKVYEIARKEAGIHLINKADQDDLNLEHLAKAFNNVVFTTQGKEQSHFNIYFPAVRDQESVAPASTSTLGGYLLEIFSAILSGADPQKVANLAHANLSNASPSLEELVIDGKGTKRKMRGKEGLYAKCIGHPNVPINKYVIPYAPEVEGSAYNKAIKILRRQGYKKPEEQLDGMNAILIRMPMIFPCGLEVEVAYPGHPLYELLNPYQPAVNPLIAYIDGGDFDGDDRLCIFVETVVQKVTIEQCLLFNCIRLGANEENVENCLRPEFASDYIGDHYFDDKGSKTFKQLLDKKGKNLLSKTKGENSEKVLGQLAKEATDVQKNVVGFTHANALINEVFSNLVKGIEGIVSERYDMEELGIPSIHKYLNTVLTTFEFYEKNLGGRDTDLYALVQDLQLVHEGKDSRFTITDNDGNKSLDIEAASNLVGDAGLNTADTGLLYEAMSFTGEINGRDGLTKDINAVNAIKVYGSEKDSIAELLKVATALHFLISKGNFSPGASAVHRRLAWIYKQWNPELRNEFEEISLSFTMLRDYLDATLAAYIASASDLEEKEVNDWLELIETTAFDPNIGRMKSDMGVSAVSRTYKDVAHEIFINRNLLSNSYKSQNELVDKVVNKLINFLPRSRFGVKSGYETYIRSVVTPKLEKCSEDQIKAVLRFFLDFFKKDKNGNTIISPLTVLSGEAGSGKSFVARDIIGDIVENATDAIWAPTGVTGVVCKDGEPTMSSLFGQKKGDVLAAGLQDILGKRPNAETLSNNLLRKLGTSPNEGRFVVFMIDEFAMASSHQLQVAMETARIALNNWYGHDKEFYNFSTLLVGDAPQMQPVKKDDEEETIVTPSYSTPIFNDGTDEVEFPSLFEQYSTIWCGLWENHRQGEAAELTKALNSLSEGNPIQEGAETEVLAKVVHNSLENPLQVFMKNRDAQKANAKKVSELAKEYNLNLKRICGHVKIAGKEWKVKMYDRSNKVAKLLSSENEVWLGHDAFTAIENEIPAWVEPVMDLVEGQNFMFRQNDRNNPRRFVNGTVGVIKEIYQNQILFEINGKDVYVEPEWLTNDSEYVFYKGFLGHSAHALTVHKTQGLTISTPVEIILDANLIDRIIKDDEYSLYGVIYTALSRVTSIDNLSVKVKQNKAFLNPESALAVINKAIRVDRKAVEFRHRAKEELKQWKLPSLEDEKESKLYLDGMDDEGNIIIHKSDSSKTEALFHPEDSEFTLKSNGKVLEKVNFKDLPEKFQNAFYALCEIEQETKRVIKEIPAHAWGVSEPLGEAELVDYDTLRISDKKGNVKDINIGEVEAPSSDALQAGRKIYLGDKTSTVYKLFDKLVQYKGQTLLSHKTTKGAYTKVFECKKDLKAFVKFLNRKPEAIEVMINHPYFLNAVFLASGGDEDLGSDGEEDNSSDDNEGQDNPSNNNEGQDNPSNNKEDKDYFDHFMNHCSREELVQHYKEYYELYHEDSENFLKNLLEQYGSLLSAIPQKLVQKNVTWDGKSLWIDSNKFFLDSEEQYKELQEYLNGSKEKLFLFGKLDNGGYCALTTHEDYEFLCDFFDGYCSRPEIEPQVMENSLFVLGDVMSENNVTNDKEKLNFVYAGVGSRSTPKRTLDFMEQIAEELAQEGYTLRSGGAEGADSAFERGCDKASGNKRVYRPNENYDPSIWKKAEKLASYAHESGDVTKCKGRKLLTRNVFQVLGEDLESPVDFIICFSELNDYGQPTGGTQVAAKVAKANKIPVFNLQVENPNEVLNKVKDLIRNKKK